MHIAGGNRLGYVDQLWFEQNNISHRYDAAVHRRAEQPLFNEMLFNSERVDQK